MRGSDQKVLWVVCRVSEEVCRVLYEVWTFWGFRLHSGLRIRALLVGL